MKTKAAYRITATNGMETRAAVAYSYPRAKAAALRLCRLLASPTGYRGYRAIASISDADGYHMETVRL